MKELGNVNRKQLLNDSELSKTKRVLIGRMYMFVYDPKHKKTLPYYDRFPLIIMVGPDEKGSGFYGLNLHYLDPLLRAAFLDDLIKAFGTEKKNPSIKARFNISYNKLKALSSVKEFKPCFKHYLSSHVKTMFSEVQGPDWETAIFLPTQHFAKAGKGKVWAESRKAAK